MATLDDHEASLTWLDRRSRIAAIKVRWIGADTPVGSTCVTFIAGRDGLMTLGQGTPTIAQGRAARRAYDVAMVEILIDSSS